MKSNLSPEGLLDASRLWDGRKSHAMSLGGERDERFDFALHFLLEVRGVFKRGANFN